MAARSISIPWDLPAFSGSAELTQGEAVTLTYTRSSATTISGWTITGYLKQYHDSETVTLTLTGTLVSSGSAGIFTLALTAAQTLALENQTYYLEVWRTDSGSETYLSTTYVSILQGLASS